MKLRKALKKGGRIRERWRESLGLGRRNGRKRRRGDVKMVIEMVLCLVDLKNQI
jgi:hypothetical protein